MTWLNPSQTYTWIRSYLFLSVLVCHLVRDKTNPEPVLRVEDSPEIGTRSCTLSALRIRCSDNATTCWHQKMSLFPQPHFTDVILHLKAHKKAAVKRR